MEYGVHNSQVEHKCDKWRPNNIFFEILAFKKNQKNVGENFKKWLSY